VSLLQQGRKATYHATYTSTGGATTGAQLALEIWQSPPRVREDTTRTQGATTNRASVFTNGATTTLCSQATGTGWTCQAVAPATFQDSGPSGVIAAVTSTLAGKQVTLAKDTIGGRAVECFQIGPVASGVKVCATDQGIPVLIAAPAVTYLMATLETTVPAGVFTAPAPVR
jgi:hypothetical protein